MTNAQVKIKFGVGFGCVLLFMLFFPALNLLTHPISVLYGTDYTPLVLRLDDFYLKTGLWIISLPAIPALMVAVIFLMQKQRLAIPNALTLLLTPFLLSLVIQYFVAVQLDKYLRFPRMGYRVPWEDVFQSGFMLDCLRLAIAYAGICAVLCFAVPIVSGKLTRSLHSTPR